MVSLFFVHTRKGKQEDVRKRGSSQQRELDAFFDNNRTNLPLTQSQLHPRGYRATSSNGSQLLNSSERMTPAEDIVVASFISRSMDPAQRSTRQQTNGRFDDSVLHGTAAFQLTGQLPPSPASGGNDDDGSDRGSEESTFDIGLSFVSNDSSAMYQAPPSESSSSSLSSNGWHAAGAGAPSNATSEQLSFDGSESDIGDFRSTGGVPSMFSDADGLDLRSTTNTNPQRRSDSAFNMFMKPSFDEVRISSGVYSNDAVPRLSGASDVRQSSNTDIVSSSYDDGDSSGDEILDEANDFSIVDANAMNPLTMSRVSELSEGSI
ncbi:hypothetical protein FI667_g9077, partial [Globisporangium splendens]